jgi:hypothetical protein
MHSHSQIFECLSRLLIVMGEVVWVTGEPRMKEKALVGIHSSPIDPRGLDDEWLEG